MPTSPSTRLGATAPLGTEQISQGDDQLRALVATLEAKVSLFATGTISARPTAAAANAGTMYLATDTGVSYFSTGTKWRVQGGHLGALTFTTSTVAPDGFLICANQAITTSFPEYRSLLIAQGNPFGVSGSNPLAPPAQGRALVATGAGAGLSLRVHGQFFGSESTVLTTAQLPAHSHVLRASAVSGGVVTESGGVIPNTTGHVRKGGADPTDGETENAGGGGAVLLSQPSVVCNLLVQVL